MCKIAKLFFHIYSYVKNLATQISIFSLDRTVKKCRFPASYKSVFDLILLGVTMAKKNTILLKLVSTAGTGFYYVKKRNPKKLQEKLAFRKYDPVVRKHVEFKEEKLKS